MFLFFKITSSIEFFINKPGYVTEAPNNTAFVCTVNLTVKKKKQNQTNKQNQQLIIFQSCWCSEALPDYVLHISVDECVCVHLDFICKTNAFQCTIMQMLFY